MFLSRLGRRLKFELERLILGSPINRLLIIAFMIVAISLVAGFLASIFAPAQFAELSNAVWWAFLRLTDPGYLGDDEGRALRTISTIVTILGYVLFMGALVALMIQWLNQSFESLSQGRTPIAQRNHILVIGWTNRTPTIIEELILSQGRVRRFLRSVGARSLRIVLLVEQITPEMLQDLRDRIRRRWSPRQIIFRSGTPLRLEHLERTDFLHAAAILVPFPEILHESSFARDERTMKILLSIAAAAREKGEKEMPLVVAELLDGRREGLARRAYGGPLEVLASDRMVSRLLAQSIRHPGLSTVYAELLTHVEGNEIYIRVAPELEGRELSAIADSFPHGVLLGLIRGGEFRPLPRATSDRIERGDRLVVLAESYERALPQYRPAPAHPPRRLPPLVTKRARKVLILGWNHKVPALLTELASYPQERFEVDLVSLVPIDERATLLERHGADLGRLALKQHDADFASLADLSRFDPAGRDNIVILGSDRLDSEAESDARTMLGFLNVEELIGDANPRPEILVELIDAANVPLLQGRVDVLISPLILSHMLTQIVLRRDLAPVFDEMFGPGGTELTLRPVGDLGLGERATFADLAAAARAGGEILIGVRPRGEPIVLNPPRDRVWTCGDGDEVLVLTADH